MDQRQKRGSDGRRGKAVFLAGSISELAVGQKTDSGLLVCAEQWKGEELTYRMTSYAVSTDRTLFGLTEFALPDGTVLHTVEE